MSDDLELEEGPRWSPPPEEPLTQAELRRLRKLLADDAHATWLRKQIRVFTPWAAAFIGGCIAVYNFFVAHWKH